MDRQLPQRLVQIWYVSFVQILVARVSPANDFGAVDFKVHGTEKLNGNPKKPGFVAHCAGDTEGSPYRLCSLEDESQTTRRVAAKLLPWTTKPANSTGARIQVSLQYTDFDTE